jgi:Helix-turn-helix domain
MSAKFVGISFELLLKPLETLVLSALADHADHNGCNAYPGVGLLAWKTGLSEREIQYILRRFEKKGIAIRRGGGGGRGDFVVYDLNFDGAPRKPALGVKRKRAQGVHPSKEEKRAHIVHPSEDERAHDVHPSENGKGCTTAQERVHHSAEKGAQRRIALMEEPSLTVHEPPVVATATTAARDGQTSRKSLPKKSIFHSHPAVVSYREITGFNQINSSQAELIASAVGEDLAESPALWVCFLKELAGRGYRYVHNVKVMVSAYEHFCTGADYHEALDAAWNKEKGREHSNGDGLYIKPELLSEKTRGNAYEIEKFLRRGEAK